MLAREERRKPRPGTLEQRFLDELEALGIKLDDLKWGLIPNGHGIGKPSPVFPRIEVKAAE